MAGGPLWSVEEDRAVLGSPTLAAYNGWAASEGYPARNEDAFLKRRTKVRQQAVRILMREDGRTEIRITKKEGALDLDRTLQWAREGQALRDERSRSQHYATITIPADRPIGLIGIGDLHLGGWSTDYELLQRLTEEILATPDLYVALLGDIAHLAVKLRSVSEVADNLLPPQMQIELALAWIDSIKERVLFATYGNHEDRLQNQAGSNHLYEMLKHKLVFADGIAHVDFCIGSQVYRGAFAHRFRWRSEHNPLWGPYKYLLREGHGNNLDLAYAADSHVPGIAKQPIGNKAYVLCNCGSIQTNSGYAKKFFSLTTHDWYPVCEFDHETHRITPFASVQEWQRTKAFGGM